MKLNRGLDFVQLDDLLIDLKLTPDVLEVPVPRCFIEDRAQVGCSAWEHGGDSPPAAALAEAVESASVLIRCQLNPCIRLSIHHVPRVSAIRSTRNSLVLAVALQELNDRDRFLQVLLEKYQQAGAAAKQAGAEQQQPQSQQPGALLVAAEAAAGGSSRAPHGLSLPVNAVSSGPPLLLDEAVAVIIKNQRGRQVGA